MHIYLWFAIVLVMIVITITSVAFVADGGHAFLILLSAMLSLAGIMVGVLFPLMATRVYERESVTVAKTYELTGIAHGGEIHYLVETGEGFQFIYFDEETGLNLINARVGDVTLIYQDGVCHLEVEETTSIFHSEWKMLRDSTTTKTEYKYHFFVPRGAVWYPYETN